MKNHPHLLGHVQHQCEKCLHHFSPRTALSDQELQHRRGSKRGLQCIRSNFVLLDPVKGDILLGEVRKKRYHLREAFDETAVVAHKIQEGLNLNFVGRPWPFPYSSAFFSSIYNPLAPTICPRNETGALVEGTF
jgi:hypothetical protein